MPRLEWLRYTAFIILYPLGCWGEMGVIEATMNHMIEPRMFFGFLYSKVYFLHFSGVV